MAIYRMTAGADTRPIFTSNGIRVLHASGIDTQVSLLNPEVLKDKFDAELMIDNVTLNPYWQIGECIGGIYRLGHFPLDGSIYDYKGLLVFNTALSEDYKKTCEDSEVTVPSENVCDMIIGSSLFDRWGCDKKEYWVEISEDLNTAVVKANKLLQAVIDKKSKSLFGVCC